MEQLFYDTNALIRFRENDLTKAIKNRAVKVRLSTRLKLMDAIVGASAIEMGLPLVTADEKFSSLRGTDVLILPSRSS